MRPLKNWKTQWKNNLVPCINERTFRKKMKPQNTKYRLGRACTVLQTFKDWGTAIFWRRENKMVYVNKQNWKNTIVRGKKSRRKLWGDMKHQKDFFSATAKRQGLLISAQSPSLGCLQGLGERRDVREGETMSMRRKWDAAYKEWKYEERRRNCKEGHWNMVLNSKNVAVQQSL